MPTKKKFSKDGGKAPNRHNQEDLKFGFWKAKNPLHPEVAENTEMKGSLPPEKLKNGWKKKKKSPLKKTHPIFFRPLGAQAFKI